MKITCTKNDIVTITLSEKDIYEEKINIDVNSLVRMEIDNDDVTFYNKETEVILAQDKLENTKQFFVMNLRVEDNREAIEKFLFTQLLQIFGMLGTFFILGAILILIFGD